ncbi:hypothetical protein [Kribbella sp. NPDC051770]|uniref:hypothetical protein n=1 Tax=Kribbella sp. NPDC051770 TaxID=3155413 RepID=UPI0034232400
MAVWTPVGVIAFSPLAQRLGGGHRLTRCVPHLDGPRAGLVEAAARSARMRVRRLREAVG